ncbi:MAG: class I SAM-dependent methyltransferase [Saprospiraceae bacterium]|nr:class I SAM-dependent methyltransferase [Saprospiraceae bacterium]|tara:strand:- start:2306 stop:2953 length:648 start_codon:yes stop_codon:yes gene_type:complete
MNGKCWDCGTGTGQVAYVLAHHFDHVVATDISQNQLENALQKDNINYTRTRSEATGFKPNTFDLITVGQAMHWFDFDAFYREVKRIGKSDGIIAIWGYGLLSAQYEVNELIRKFYSEKIGPYWNKERKHIDNQYSSIPFNFDSIKVNQGFKISTSWSLDNLEGYLNTWSAVKRYVKQNNENPIPQLINQIKPYWAKEESHRIEFPLFIKIGRIGI